MNPTTFLFTPTLSIILLTMRGFFKMCCPIPVLKVSPRRRHETVLIFRIRLACMPSREINRMDRGKGAFRTSDKRSLPGRDCHLRVPPSHCHGSQSRPGARGPSCNSRTPELRAPASCSSSLAQRKSPASSSRQSEPPVLFSCRFCS